MIELPSPDRRLSPVTGWTREHWVAVGDHLLASVTPYASRDFAQYRLPGRTSRSGPVSDGLEGYARTFLLAAFRIAGGGSADEPPADLVDRYTRGLIAGTDPDHPYAWPALADMSQQLVEAASIAVALHETRPWIFDQLSPTARDRVLGWLAGFVGKRTPDSNWVLFQVIVEQFLANAGGPHDPAEITGGLDRIETWYAGDGWYSDGAGQNFDYYCGWAMLLYPVLWARMSGDTGRGRRYADRLRQFLDQYQHFFAADGAPLHQGRSLTYRFATVAPLWLGALTGDTPLPPGLTRRIASGVLRHFVERGAPDHRGLLTLGWYDEFLPTTQSYSGPASPYWASKGFLGLLLPADHPVWAEVEQPAPIDTGDHVVALPAPGWLLHGTQADGIVRLVNHGSDRAGRPSDSPGPDPHYTRLGYSSHTGPLLGTDPVDGQLTVTAPDGTAAERRRIERIGVHDRFAASRFRDGPVRVSTASIVDGGYEIRVHVVDAPAGHRVRDGGYAISGAEPPSVQTRGHHALVRRPDGLTGLVRALHGFTTAGVARATDASAFGAHAATPFVTADHPGGTAVYVSLVALFAAPSDDSRTADVLDVTGTRVMVRLPGGDTVTLRLGDGPDTTPTWVRTTADGRTVVWPPDHGGVDTVAEPQEESV
ncbi:DUF2264 domain-containing protein [Plantactinospora sp. CA-294935]|uniref:DUF2264 domain-containing protein n=1 Tax=Plantactinospora sp. CA-294935 TaxID=3240012 RepID=UPI003D9279D4